MALFSLVLPLLSIFNMLFTPAPAYTVDRNSRIDCASKPGLTADNCTHAGCVWDQVSPNPTNIPWCYFPSGTGYTLDGQPSGTSGIKLKRLQTGGKNPYGTDFGQLVVKSTPMGKALALQITIPAGGRYIPPVPLNNTAKIVSNEELVFQYQTAPDTKLFSFTVQRKSDGCRLWDTAIGGLLFSDKYIQIATNLPSDRVYGLGENLHHNLKVSSKFFQFQC